MYEKKNEEYNKDCENLTVIKDPAYEAKFKYLVNSCILDTDKTSKENIYKKLRNRVIYYENEYSNIDQNYNNEENIIQTELNEAYNNCEDDNSTCDDDNDNCENDNNCEDDNINQNYSNKIYQCEHNCGFEGNYDKVVLHELRCKENPKNILYPKCLSGHSLYERTPTTKSKYVCDICNKTNIKETLYGCDNCDWDICKECMKNQLNNKKCIYKETDDTDNFWGNIAILGGLAIGIGSIASSIFSNKKCKVYKYEDEDEDINKENINNLT